MNWSEVTAVLGGTFDPPHLGHREAARGLFENPGVRRVLILPSGNPPFKPGATVAEHRSKMTELCFEGLEKFGEVRIDRRELERATAPTYTPTYTIDTLLELRREIPKIAFVAGTDQLADLHVWHRFPELLGAAHWIILARKPAEGQGSEENSGLQTLRQWEASGLLRKDGEEWVTLPGGGSETRMKLVATRAPAVSSSGIRREIALATDPGKLRASLERQLSPAVLAYLMEHHVYGMSEP